MYVKRNKNTTEKVRHSSPRYINGMQIRHYVIRPTNANTPQIRHYVKQFKAVNSANTPL